MDPRDKEMIARKLRRQSDQQYAFARAIAEDAELGGLTPTEADIKYEVHMGLYAALSTIATDFEERLPR